MNNIELLLSIKDSLWYAIIMRLAKICEDDTQVNSIYKIINCCMDNSLIVKQNFISVDSLKEMKFKINCAITDESGNNINLLKSWRDKYLAHYSKLVDPLSTQEKFLLTNNKLDHIINVLVESLELLKQCFDIDINDIYIIKKIENLKMQFNSIYNVLKKNI